MTPLLAQDTLGFPLLSLLLALPALGALATLATRKAEAAIVVARLTAMLTLGLSLLAVGAYDPTYAGPQLVEDVPWLPGLDAAWHLGVDGLSITFLPLTALLLVVILLGVDPHRVVGASSLAALVLLLGTALLGVYVALDVVVFFGFWELGLAPSLLLLGLWGTGVSRRRVASRVLISLLLGGLPLLFGLLALAYSGGAWETDLTVLAATPAPLAVQAIALPLVLLGLATKAPLPPFHGWMPEALGEGPAALGALVVGLKIGAWAMLRLALPLCPEAFHDAAPWLAGLAGSAVLYAGLVAWRQTTLRRLVAWLGISHVGVVVLGIASQDPTGIQGALFALGHFPLAAAALVLLAGVLRERLRSEDVHGIGGLAGVAPRLTAVLLVAGLAAAGLPGTTGFVGELLAVVGGFRAHPWTLALAVPGLAVGAAALARMGASLLGGPPSRAAVAELRDLDGAEALPILLLLTVSVAGGLAPSWPLTLTHLAAQQLAAL